MSTPFWPCPHGCESWVRCINPRVPQPNHHPECEHVNASLIDVWRVRLAGETEGGYLTDCEPNGAEASESEVTVTKEKIHKEIYENLREFGGF